jgi:ATP-dependent helicase HrpB
VLATNVAETSLTIDGITAVIDSGLARQNQVEPGLGLNRLALVRISKASAEQRAGRAGRTAPGVCFRLWTERQQQALDEQSTPEIRRVDLAGPVLELQCWGERDVKGFPWFEPPPEAALDQALSLLRRLQAIDDRGPTDVGRSMVRLPVHPRIARLLLEGERLGAAHEAALAAALLSEREPWPRGPAPRGAMKSHNAAGGSWSDSDVLDRVSALADFDRSNRRDSSVGRLDAGAARHVLRASEQLERLLREEGTGRARGKRTDEAGSNSHDALLRALRRFPIAWRGVASQPVVAASWSEGVAYCLMSGARCARLNYLFASNCKKPARAKRWCGWLRP